MVTLPAADSLRANLMSALEPDVSVQPVLGGIVADGPAHRAGLESGDRILEAGGRRMRDWQDFVAVIERSPGRAVSLTVQRGSRQVSIQVTPDPRNVNDVRFGRIGVSAYFSSDDVMPRQQGLIRADPEARRRTW
jgi:regulator of sigma E protease